MMEDSLDLVDQKENVLNEAPKSANKKGLNSRSSPRSSTQQNSIMSMFAKMSNKRKSSAEGEPSKKLKREPNTDRSSLLESPLVGPEVGDLKPELGDAEKAVRCNCCLQYPDDPDVHNLIADPEDSQEEFVTLTQPLLSIYEDNQSASLEERVQHKITNFSVYGECKHLCSFDEGLIEKNKALYFRGYVKPIYCEDSSITDGMAFPTKSMGPIVEWFTSGFDGMFAIVGFSTAYADYFLMEASDEYKPLMSVVREKVFVSNLVISHLLDEPFSTYSDLLDKLQSAERPPGVTCSLNEDTVIRHAQFVIDQVQSFDAADDKETEDRIIDTQCIADLMNLSGATRKVHPAGAKSKIRSRITKKKKTGHETMSYATTTPLVARVFNEMFKTEINKTTGLRDCGSCAGCEAETEIKKCNNPQQVDDVYEYNGDDENNATKYNKSKAKAEEISVIGKPGKTCDGTKYYNKLAWMDTEIKVGDCVFVRDSEHEIGIVEYIYVSPKNKPQLHLHWLLPGTETVLGELADPRELFLIDECDDVSAKRINYPIKLIFRDTSSDWSECGGDEAGRSPVNPSAETIYFYQKWYNAEMARFEDVPQIPKADLTECTSCNSDTRKRMEMVFGKRVEGTKDCYESVAYYGNTYKVGGCVYLPPDLYKYKYKRRSNGKDTIDMSQFKDRTKYPEFYRRTNTYVKGSNDECPPPYLVGFISAISRGKSDDPESVHLDINKLYRPENTHLSDDEVFSSDLNLLYWSSEESRVTLSSACGSSLLFYLSNEQANDISLIDKLFERQYFYITKAYDGIAKNFIKIPEEICNRYTLTSMPSNPLPKPLRCLDVFAGCGGLSAGLHQAGAAVSHWAIEKVDEAAKAYALNAPDCQVFTEDCNVLLKMVMEGKKETRLGQKLPQKGEVEMLCGGPPCQGFSGMNRFNHREYSRFKNSLIASYLSYADYYRPKFFILENVRNFVSYKKSGILKMALRCLIAMGYQCTFGVMQAGCYGVAQTRRRAIIFAAAPGEVLPRYPEPRHVFAPKAMALTVMINEQKYLPIEQNLHSAPFRTVTVRDCMSDLPVIENGSKISEMKYTKARITHFQRLIRGGNTKVNDHICKNMNALVCTRMSYVPTIPGADWRLLPNIEVKLRDGTRTKKLKYTHNDPEARARDPKAGFRGVCSCAEGDKCEPSDRQFETLIPWCLPHTGNRHNHWAGLYGRLEWDGFFSTTVTNPEPMGKQGRVLHPEQHRVVSVRECARSQGFPDTFKFYGEVLDKHRQVGNAVPPPLGKALGLEVIKARNSEK